MILIADSGSTKTAWCIANKQQQTYITTQGINPYHQTPHDITHIITHELINAMAQHGIQPQHIQHIHYYGAGCTPQKTHIINTALQQTLHPTLPPNIATDMLGAARALCGNQPGIACILGTGSNSCQYDGKNITASTPPLGYILGDEGSGAYIGKRLVADILKQQLPNELCQQFYKQTNTTPDDIIQHVYQQPLPNRYLATLSTFCATQQQHPAIQQLLIDSFTQFITRNIKQYNTTHNNTIHYVGSIAYHYQQPLTQATKQCGYNIGNIIQAPLQALVNYHLNNH